MALKLKPTVEEREATFHNWKAQPNPDNLGKVVNAYSGLLHSELPKYMTGNLPLATIKGYGKKVIIDSLNTYDPNKGRLANHIVQNLQKLHRINYETSSFFRLSEDMQRGSTMFKNKKQELSDTLMREPTPEELSQALKWTPSKVRRMEKNLMKESISSNIGFAPAYVNMEDPKIDYLYHDLSPEDKLIFQYKTGYRGAPVLKLSEIAKKVNLSMPAISIRAGKIAKTLNEVFKNA